jgi:hypothetical protein
VQWTLEIEVLRDLIAGAAILRQRYAASTFVRRGTPFPASMMWLIAASSERCIDPPATGIDDCASILGFSDQQCRDECRRDLPAQAADRIAYLGRTSHFRCSKYRRLRRPLYQD